MEKPLQDRQLSREDLLSIGCSDLIAQRVLDLLSQQDLLNYYLCEGKREGCYPITRVSPAYPGDLRQTLGPDAPGVLWAKGDKALLQTPMISVVGSRELEQQNHLFAREVGKQAALQGYTLVSGNARGADRTAQNACLDHGGKVISVVADRLADQPQRRGILYLSEEGFDLDFSSHRALQRNRIIHCLGEKVFVAQCAMGKGGTWSGTKMNLRNNWRPVFCFADGSDAAGELEQMGAVAVTTEDLSHIADLHDRNISFMDI